MADKGDAEVSNTFPDALNELLGRKGGKNRLRLSVFRAEALAMSAVRDKAAVAYAAVDDPKTPRSISRIVGGKSGMRRAPSGMSKGQSAEWTDEEKLSYRKGVSAAPRYRVGPIAKKGASRDDPDNPWSWTFLEFGTKFQPARRIMHNTLMGMKGGVASSFSGALTGYIAQNIAELEAKERARAAAIKRKAEIAERKLAKAAAKAAKEAAKAKKAAEKAIKKAAAEAKKAEKAARKAEKDALRAAKRAAKGGG